MTAQERQDQALINRVHDTLEKGRVVAVLGWMKSNHDKFTRRVQKTGKVIFYEKSPDRLGTSVGFAIFRLGITHSDFQRLSVRTDCHPTVLSHGDIKRVLRVCCKEQQVKPVVPVVVPEPVVVSIPKLEVPVQTAPEEKKMEDMAGFIKAFMKEAGDAGVVGRNSLGIIRRNCGIDGPNTKLVKLGWIVPVVSEGRTEVGSYKASEKMLKEAGLPGVVPSDDPFAQARAFIAREPMLVEEVLQAEIKLEELRAKLSQISAAKELLAKLTELTK